MGAEDARRQELTRLVMAAQPTSFWLDSRDAPAVREPLRGEVACDLAVVGGGFGSGAQYCCGSVINVVAGLVPAG